MRLAALNSPRNEYSVAKLAHGTMTTIRSRCSAYPYSAGKGSSGPDCILSGGLQTPPTLLLCPLSSDRYHQYKLLVLGAAIVLIIWVSFYCFGRKSISNFLLPKHARYLPSLSRLSHQPTQALVKQFIALSSAGAAPQISFFVLRFRHQ